MVLKFKFDIIFKKKPGSDSIYKYEKLELWHTGEINLAEHDGTNGQDFCNRIPNEKDLGQNLTWVPTIFGDISGFVMKALQSTFPWH